MNTIRPFSPADPFVAQRYGDIQTWHITADDRIGAVRRFSMAQCEAALRLANLQKSVERALRNRMRTLRAATAAAETCYAWCWASGLIEIGATPPPQDDDGAIVFARGRQAALERVLGALARLAHNGDLLVPGVPEAECGDLAVDALAAWVAFCSRSNGADHQSGVVFGANVQEVE